MIHFGHAYPRFTLLFAPSNPDNPFLFPLDPCFHVMFLNDSFHLIRVLWLHIGVYRCVWYRVVFLKHRPLSTK